MTAIRSVQARRVWDSRGNPTVEAEVTLENGISARAIAPSGASRGSREALDKRDGGTRLRGLDVQQALTAIRERIAPALAGREVSAQREIDGAILALDPSPLKADIGGNAAIATSLAVLHASAADQQEPLWRRVAGLSGRTPLMPLPEIQIFGGGAHAGRRTDVQDFMIMVPGAHSFSEALEVTNEVYFAAGDIMRRKGRMAGVADEGGWWPIFDSNEEALETLVAAIELAGEAPGKRVVISLDIAASEFGKKGRYRLALDDREMTTEALIDMLGGWLDAYPIAAIEDPVAEDDVAGMVEFTRRFGDRVQIIGDDYLVTNAGLIREAARQGACNAALIKVNQAGTVTESLDAFAAAANAGWGAIVSARSGETEDVSISHLSVGLGCGQLKVGSFTRSERMAKWNECLRIEEQLGEAAFAGATPLRNTAFGKNGKLGEMA